MPRARHASASPYEASIGFSRAVRVGRRILVSGTAPVEADGSSTPGDAEAQAERCLQIIVEAVGALGGAAIGKSVGGSTGQLIGAGIGGAGGSAIGAKTGDGHESNNDRYYDDRRYHKHHKHHKKHRKHRWHDDD